MLTFKPANYLDMGNRGLAVDSVAHSQNRFQVKAFLLTLCVHLTILAGIPLAFAQESTTIRPLQTQSTLGELRLDSNEIYGESTGLNSHAVTAYASISGHGGQGEVFSAPFYFAIPNDTLSYFGSNYVDGIHVDHNFGGTRTVGSRAGLTVNLRMTAPTSNTGNVTQYYVGVPIEVSTSFNDGGRPGFGQARGSIVGINPIAALGPGATYYYTANAAEFDTQVAETASVAHKFGILLVLSGDDFSRGEFDDAAVAFATGADRSRGWKYLLQNGKSDGKAATTADSVIIGCVPNVHTGLGCPAKYGVDFLDGWDWGIAGEPFRSPNFHVDGHGDVVAAAVQTGTLGVSGQLNTSGAVSLAVRTVEAGTRDFATRSDVTIKLKKTIGPLFMEILPSCQQDNTGRLIIVARESGPPESRVSVSSVNGSVGGDRQVILAKRERSIFLQCDGRGDWSVL